MIHSGSYHLWTQDREPSTECGCNRDNDKEDESTLANKPPMFQSVEVLEERVAGHTEDINELKKNGKAQRGETRELELKIANMETRYNTSMGLIKWLISPTALFTAVYQLLQLAGLI